MLQGIQLSAFPQVAPYPIRNPPRQRSQPRVSTATPAPPQLNVSVSEAFPVGTRVRVLRGCCQGLESTVTAIQPHLKHSIVLEPGKGRFSPDMLERVTAPPPEPIRFKKGDYVSPQCHRPQDIGIVLSCRVWVKVQWLTHTGCSREHPTTLKHRSPQEPAVVAVTQRHLLTPAQISPEPPTPKPQRRYSPKGQAVGWIEERQGNQKRKTPSTSYYYCWQDATGKHKRYIKASKVTRVHQMVTQRQPTQTILDFLKPEAR